MCVKASNGIRNPDVEDEVQQRKLDREFRAKGATGIDIDEVYGRLVELGVLAGRTQGEMDKMFWKKHKANDRGGEKEVKALGLVPTEAGYDVSGKVDAQAELDEVLNWAINPKPESRRNASVPRASVNRPIDEANVPTE